MSNEIGNMIPVPGFSSVDETTDDELLLSSVGYTQAGVVLASGQGILPLGTVLGQRTSDKKFVVYNNAASNGSQTARAILRHRTDTSDGDVLANVVTMGKVRLSKLSGLDSAAITDFAGRSDSVMDSFTF